MTPDEMARQIAAAMRSREDEPPATRQLRAAGEELGVLDPLSRAVYACKSWEVQLRLCDEVKYALLRAIAHVEEANHRARSGRRLCPLARPRADLRPMSGLLPSVLIALWAFLIAMTLRNDRVATLRFRILGQVSAATRADFAAGRAWEWRYTAYETVSYAEMLWKFWRPLRPEAWWTNTDFMIAGRREPTGVPWLN